MHIVIRAGGKGTRLWPLSTSKKPKQFQDIIKGKSTFALTLERIKPLLSGHKLYVSTIEESVEDTVKQLEGVKVERLIIEPFRRDTAAAVGLEAIYAYHQDPEAIVVGLASDHVIQDTKQFLQILRVGETFINQHPEYLLEIGVKPTHPDTAYGYIKMGKKLDHIRDRDVYRVEKFVEKPKLPVAKRYVVSGQYLWNANMGLWKARTMLDLFKKHQPVMYQSLMKIYDAIDTKKEEIVLRREYKTIQKIAIDYAIREKVKSMAVIPADIGWTDIGSFLAMRDLLAAQGENLVEGVRHISLDTKNSVIYGDNKHIIATIGLSDIAIIEKDDVVLVLPLDRCQDIKKLVESMESQQLDRYI